MLLDIEALDRAAERWDRPAVREGERLYARRALWGDSSGAGDYGNRMWQAASSGSP